MITHYKMKCKCCQLLLLLLLKYILLCSEICHFIIGKLHWIWDKYFEHSRNPLEEFFFSTISLSAYWESVKSLITWFFKIKCQLSLLHSNALRICKLTKLAFYSVPANFLWVMFMHSFIFSPGLTWPYF